MFSRHVLPLCSVAALLVATPSILAAQLKHGDVNGDGIVGALDAQAILTHVVSLPLPQGYVVANGDANCDAATGALDAQLVLSYVIGLDVSQHCVGQAFGPGALTMTITPGDTSVLINSGMRFRALLKDSTGTAVERPISWSSSNIDLIVVDSARGDTAWVSNKGAAVDAVATLTATADGVSKSVSVRVYRTYQGIIITPQRPDTMRQLNSTYNFTARSRDSLGVVSGFPSAFWSIADTTIATVPNGPSNGAVVRTKINGTTWLYAVSSLNSADKDSVRLVIQNPVLSACTGSGGTLHPTATFTTPQTWTVANGPHYLSGSLTFNSGSSLTIEPGVLVCAQSGGYMVFRQGSRLTALGTVTEPIRFTTTNVNDFWYGIQLGDASSYVTTPLADTSRLRNVLLERGSNGNGVIDGRHQHVVLMDSVHVRESYYSGVALYSPGSLMTRSRVDSANYDYSGYYAVTLGRASLEESAIRIDNAASGIYLAEAATVRQVSIHGGTHAIEAGGSADSARLNDITITGTSGTALVLDGGLIHPASGNVVVTGGTGGVFRGGIGNFAHLYPDSVAQESLKNNGKDTVQLYYGALVNRTLTLRPDLAWRVEGTVQIDTMAQLVVRPGTTIDFNYGYLYFIRGGTMDARGTATAPIRFRPIAGTAFYGLDFESPGQGGSPFSAAPVAQSVLTNVRVDSATGVCCSGGFGYGAVIGADRHRLIIDSALVRMSQNGGVHLTARGSRISRSVIDTTGSPTTFYPGLGLGDSTTADSVTIRRSGQVGVSATGAGARLRNVRILNSVSYGLQAENGLLLGDSGSVIMEGNAYPGRIRIENLALLAPDSASQRAWFTSTTTDSVLIVTSGQLTRDTVTAIPQLRWQLENQVYFDTLALFRPRPGARITGYNGGLVFRQGGTIDARGTASLPIRFHPAAAGVNFYGLDFDNPGAGSSPFTTAPVAQSYLVNVRVDSASGQCCSGNFGYAAVNAEDRHRVTIDSVIVRQSHNGAVHLAARGSSIARSLIDTTGLPTTSYVALGLGDSTTADSVTVRRSGHVGVNAPGTGARLRKVTILNSVQYGLQAASGRLQGDSASVTMEGNAYVGRMRIENFALLAPDSASQRAWFTSTTTDSVIVVTSGNLTRDTITAIPQLRWQLENQVYFDTLSLFAPRPGARISGYNGGLVFRQGGRIDARGTATRPIHFFPATSGVNFYGIDLEEPGAGGSPFTTAPVTESYLINVRVDSASGQCCSANFGYAAISAEARHRVFVDSARIRRSHNGAVHLAARGSSISRSVIDTTGAPVTTSYVALGLSDSTRADSVTVRGSGHVGVSAPGAGVKLRKVQILNSAQYGLYGETGIFFPDSQEVTLSGNAYAGRLRLENVARVMRDSVAQARALNNVSDVLVVTGGTLTNDTVTAIPLLRWQVEGTPTFSTGAEFRPKKGARITGWNGGLTFQGGARLYAVGTATDTIRFYPAAAGVNFYGLRMEGTTADDFPSTLAFARIDSASGQNVTGGMSGTAAINVAAGHSLNISNTRLHRSLTGAVHLHSNSSLSDVLIDTTGNGVNLSTSDAAIRLGTDTYLSNVVVRRSGGTGIALVSTSSVWSDVFVYDSRDIGIRVESGSTGLTLNDFVVDSATTYGIRVDAPSVTFDQCDVLSTRASPGTNFLVTANGGTNVVISRCNIEGWLANAVSSTGTTSTTASGNFWAPTRGGASTTTPTKSSTGTGTINTATPATVRHVH